MLIFAVSGVGLVAVVAIGAGISMAVYTIAMHSNERAVVRSSLRQLDGYEVENVRDRELINPLRERAIIPALQRLTELGRRLTPQGYVDTIRQKFVYAGSIGADDVDRFLAIRFVTAAAVGPTMIAVWILAPLSGALHLAVTLLAGFVLLAAPDAILNRRVEDRQHQLRIRLPDILDLLVISVEAGLGFEQALDRTVAAVPGPLSDEFARMLGEVRAGASRADAMRALDKRANVPEVRSFVLAILQADTFGVSIGRVLRSQADEMRVKRRQIAQEQAQKAPVKMLVPMVFCVFPALFVVVLGPAVINIYNNL